MNDLVVIGGEISLLNVIDGDASLINTIDGEYGTYVAFDTKYEFYEDEYTVIPKTVPQTLNTSNKVMKDDVTVTEIPYFETTNESGITVYIADRIGG